MHAAPGGPFTSERPLPAQVLANIDAKYGLDQPIWRQMINYLWGVITEFDFGPSYKYHDRTVNEIIGHGFPITLKYGFWSFVVAVGVGIPLGAIAAIRKNTWIDYSIQLLSTLGMSVPSFFSAIVFAWFFGYVLNEFTGLNMTGSLYELDDYGEKMKLQLKNLILPSLVLGIRPIAVISQMMRNSLLKVLSKNYIKTAYAKGLSRFNVVKNHAIKNSLNPVITALSGWFASMLAGSVFVEYIFGWNGLGKEIVDALNKLDVPVLIGSVLTISIIFIMINIFVDIIYTWLDPRTKNNF